MVESRPTELMDSGETPPPVAGRFLKILIPGFETALKLPPAFSRMLNNTDLNSKTALLKSCKGSWTVVVKKCDHGCLHFLGKTWEDYVSEHNLNEGDFIVFEHKGRLHFSTIMFDETYCEKDFATSEEDEEESTCEDDVEQCSEEESSSEDYVEECFEEESSSEDGMDEEDNDDEPIEGNYSSTADQIANSSRFQTTIAKWTFKRGCVCVPKLFARSNGMMQNKTVKLRNGTGDSWLAKLQVANTTQANKPPSSRVFFTGLYNFLTENNLEIGDKCTFELAQPSRSSQGMQHIVIDVVFEKERGKENSPRRNEFNQNFKSQFQLTLTRWNCKRYVMTVPMSFVRSNDLMRDRSVKLQNGIGDSWLVRLLVYHTERANRAPDDRVLLTSLGEFMRDNDLQVGDTCIFKLVQPSTRQEHVVMDVVVLRKP